MLFCALCLLVALSVISSPPTAAAAAAVDVIVIGGGISGVFAAHEIQSYSNLSVIVRPTSCLLPISCIDRCRMRRF